MDFASFVRRDLAALSGYAYVLTGDRHQAQDLVQDTLVRLARVWDRVDPAGNPSAFARTTMVRLHLSALRRARLWRRSLPVLAVADPARDPAYERVEDLELLRAALRQLSPPQRAVVALTYYDDHDDASIARILRRRPGAVRALRHRALLRLRAALGDPASVDGRRLP
ncbi:sigma-70 family RNA polymerase sigma factor [Dactylosporangium sp. NPDC005572]|uniref:RNA polymerase sigma factor n=1 Tax=Dactylosporangium sp. NPDC005572 TaxID=3156889 RepID=UPI0033ACB7BD